MGGSIACWCQNKTLVCASLLLITCSWEYYGGSLRHQPTSLLFCSWRGTTRLFQPVLRDGRCSIHSVWVTRNVSTFLVSFGTIHVHSLSILLVPIGWSRYHAGVAECSSHQERVDCISSASAQVLVKLKLVCDVHVAMQLVTGAWRVALVGRSMWLELLEEHGDDREIPVLLWYYLWVLLSKLEAW